MPNVQFERQMITVRERPLADALGRPIQFRNTAGRPIAFPLTIGVQFPHWAAPRSAAAWFAIANAFLQDRTHIESLKRAGASAQFEYLNHVCEAIANGYNCLNIVWWNDPIARAAYRKWISGPPYIVRSGGAIDLNRYVFGSAYNWGGAFGWFTGAYDTAVLYTESTVRDGRLRIDQGTVPPAGIIPRKTRELFDRCYPHSIGPSVAALHRVLFIPSIGFSLAVAPGTESTYQNTPTPPVLSKDYRPLSVETSKDVLNVFWINMEMENHKSAPEGPRGGPLVMAYPKLYEWDPSNSAVADWVRGTHAVASMGEPITFLVMTLLPGGGWVVREENCQTIPRGEDAGWTAFRFLQATTEFNPNVELPAAVGPESYVEYLREWMAAVVQRSSEDAILDSRVFLVYQNIETILNNGGVRALAEAQAHVTTDVITQQTARNPTIAMTQQVVGAAGAALAPGTGGIAGVVAGVIGIALEITDAMMTEAVLNNGKDDLGRWKPTIERAWLSGDGAADPMTGSPKFDVPAPNGFVEPRTGRTFLTVALATVTSPKFGPTSKGDSAKEDIATKEIEVPQPLTHPAPGTLGYVSSSPKPSRAPWIIAGLAAFAGIAKVVSDRRRKNPVENHPVFAAVEAAGRERKLHGLDPRPLMVAAARGFTRDELIEALVWNDRNGVYRDEDVIAEGLPKLTKKHVVDYVVGFALGGLGY